MMMKAENKNPRDGLAWDDSGFDAEPVWTREPSTTGIETVCRRNLGIAEDAKCDVSFYASGAFNKLYLVRSDGGKLLMRVSLPVDPGDKTRGEVATVRWVREQTDTPVPRIIAFDDSSDNEMGFEWILMELMEGPSAHRRWRGMDMAQKEALVRRVAEYQAQMFDWAPGRFRGIGTLGLGRHESSNGDENSDGSGNGNENSGRDPKPVPRKMVSLRFFWGDRFDYDVPRGPFRSSHDWLGSLLRIIALDYEAALREAEDDEDRQDAERGAHAAQRLQALLPEIFPRIRHPPERTYLWHGDLSLQNILVGDDGRVSAVLDSECVSTMPRWATTAVPGFLVGNPREEEPARDRYGDDDGDDDDDDGLDNEGKNELYWIHLLEFEQTRLRGVYAARMEELRPGWAAEVRDGELKTDFLEAARRCEGGFHLRNIVRWVDAVERGEVGRLADALRTAVR